MSSLTSWYHLRRVPMAARSRHRRLLGSCSTAARRRSEAALAAAAVLLADPLRVAGSPYDDLGSGQDGLLAHLLMGTWGGFGPVEDVIPPAMRGRVHSYCLGEDPVCNATPTALLASTRKNVHKSYRNNPGRIADRAAAFAASRLLT